MLTLTTILSTWRQKKITFAQLFERWQKIRYKDSVFPSEYVAAYKKLVPLYNMPFADIRKRHIQFLIDDLKVGHSSKNHIKSLCTMLFSYAIDLEIVSTIYASLVQLPPKKQSEIHQPFTPDELKTLWQNANDFTARLALILCYTGMRPTELLQIKTADIVLRQKFMRGGIKTVAGKNRVIPIADKILPFIAEQVGAENKFLVTENGKSISYPNFRQRYWEKSEVLKSLPTKHLPHDGRHTCATLMDNAEIPLKIRQLILGHSATDTTNKIYTHKTIQQLIDAINKI